MFKKKVKTDEPLKVVVGEVTFHILRIGARHVTLGIDAPKEIQIQMPVESPSCMPVANVNPDVVTDRD